MPQARLPDINTAFIVYRREAISSWKSKTYDSCFGSIQTLNGLLPDKYRVLISDLEYNAQVNRDILYTCYSCKEQHERGKLKVYEIVMPMLANFVTGALKEAVWDCPKCEVQNKVSKTDMIKQVLQEPYFLGVVPKPPIRREGMKDRSRFHSHFSVWFWTVMSEIESKMAQFRDDNWHKSGEEYEFDEADTEGGEELD